MARAGLQVGDRLVGVERGALKDGRQKAAAPVERADLRNAARIGDGHEGRQILVLGAQRVADPRARCSGNPSSVKPVFICDSAGPCVLAFAVIEWMKHISSTSSARCGSRSETYLPDLPRGLNAYGDRVRLPFSP